MGEEKFPVQSLLCRLSVKGRKITRLVFRALGLAIIIHTIKSFGHPTGRGLHEPVKVAISQSRTITLLRSLLHLVPVSVALCEIVLNWNTYYVGASIHNQALYQAWAKAYEITIQASLARVLLSYIRYELVVGNGLPFGALVSGIFMNQIGYLWSMELCGTIGSAHSPALGKLALLTLAITCIVLTTISGPASAVLLIPRLGY